MPKKTVFLDRDGVINADESDFIRSLADFTFLPGSINAISRLTRHGFSIFVITNQSGVGRGIIDPGELERIFSRMTREIEMAGGNIAGIYFCPHHPKDACQCRKPEPGLILQAAKDHDIDLSRAVMVGDRARDIESAIRAGCALSVLVGADGEMEQKMLLEKKMAADAVVKDLSRAADWIIAQFCTSDAGS